MKLSKCSVLLANVGLLFSLSACGSGNTTANKTSSSSESTKADKHQDETIDYKKQEDWKFESGKMQSPINIDTKKVKTTDKENDNHITLSINPTVKNVEDNGHAIEIKTTGNAKINGRHFKLEQFHIHTPSEHTLNGKSYPAEIHFVTKSSNGRIAVIAEFVKVGKENQAMASIEQDLSKHRDDKIKSVNQLLPTNMNNYYHYLGSLTTPPLTENVEWYVLEKPMTVSKAQLKDLESYHKGNNRKVQPINDRVIEENK